MEMIAETVLMMISVALVVAVRHRGDEETLYHQQVQLFAGGKQY